MTKDRVYFVVAVSENHIEGTATHIVHELNRSVTLRLQNLDKQIQSMQRASVEMGLLRDMRGELLEKLENSMRQKRKQYNNILYNGINQPPGHFTTPWKYDLNTIIEKGQEKIIPARQSVKV